jgi:S-adenosylmethionine synthetase
VYNQINFFLQEARPTSPLCLTLLKIPPGQVIRAFDLRYQPQLFRGNFCRQLAVYGHLGRMDVGLPWEKTDKAAALR